MAEPGLAGEPGFEPRLTESESAVLPLNYSPNPAGERTTPTQSLRAENAAVFTPLQVLVTHSAAADMAACSRQRRI